MTLYIVTKHQDYYPRGGSDDWYMVTSSLEEAQKILAQDSGDAWGTIVEISQTDQDEWFFRDIATQ